MAGEPQLPPEKNGVRDGWICLGVITGAAGLKGEVRVKTFTEAPEAIGDYGPVTGARSGRKLALKVSHPIKGGVAARLDGVKDRDAAEALKGEQLYIPRTALPDTGDENTFYHADLIGLVVEDDAGARLGFVKAIYDFGAGEMLEVTFEGAGDIKPRIAMIPFTKAIVPVVDVAGGKLVVKLPPEGRVPPEMAGE